MAVVIHRQKQLNIRIGASLYQQLEVLARQEKRSVAQLARLLLEEAIQHRLQNPHPKEDTTGDDIAVLAAAGGTFDWLADEPDLYNDTCGEPV